MTAEIERLAPATPVSGVEKQRHGGTDVLRVAAVIGVAFFHANLLAQLPALIGMHALIAASVMFAARPSVLPLGILVGRRASRLLVPWLFFSSLHGLAVVRSGTFKAWMLIAGPSLHLWFVPFIFVATTLVAVVCRHHSWPRSWSRVVIWSVVSLLFIHMEARYTPAIVNRLPMWQFLDAATAALVAMSVLSVPGRTAMRLLVAAAIALLAVPLWTPWRDENMMTVSPAALGVILYLTVTLLRTGTNRFTEFLGRASFGLYLSHMLVLAVLVRLVARTAM